MRKQTIPTDKRILSLALIFVVALLLPPHAEALRIDRTLEVETGITRVPDFQLRMHYSHNGIAYIFGGIQLSKEDTIQIIQRYHRYWHSEPDEFETKLVVIDIEGAIPLGEILFILKSIRSTGEKIDFVLTRHQEGGKFFFVNALNDL